MKENSQNRERFLYIDVLNIFACLSVIFMHCNGIVHSYTNTRAWYESMVVETLAYWAVPIFFMISGAMLMDYRNKYDTVQYFKKRILKTVIPFIVWTIISLVFKIFTNFIVVEKSVSYIVGMFTNTTVESVYWFFIPLFMVYLSLPVISLIKDHTKVLIYMVVCAFVIYSVYPTVCVALSIPMNGNFIFPVAGGYMMFSILGYLLFKTELSKKNQIVIYILGFLGICIRYAGTVVLSVKSDTLDTMFWGHLNFPSVFLAIAVFVAAKSIPWERIFFNVQFKKVIMKLSSASYGVYLIHMIVYRSMLLYTGINEASYRWRFIMPFVIYGISVAVVLVIKKIPLVKNIVP